MVITPVLVNLDQRSDEWWKWRSEEWRAIVVAGNEYRVSDMGRVQRWSGGRGAVAGRMLKPHAVRKGYMWVELSGKSYSVHSLVMLLFAGPRPEGYEINHKDGQKANNRRTNLEYVTQAENMAHAVAMGLKATGERCGAAKLTGALAEQVRSLASTGLSFREIGRRFGVHHSTVANVVYGVRWA